ncbi:bifunctional 2-C-methyl-D-erythritol 4-phosphate cytidylyltransferase/2-C-methyl-D-erythritol 2,4-cyclodiphosphate synthase [Devosia sp. 63-57]|uniref:bifunctional 2-C-methyl-D-erythritol 4-phosphate cytidylyltransferase/2-C-methyl-D-erythritol 2,4-cyclodiphosphate synthase n=1 Tax=Devosia sp. 63-57 TaxID=1895751 RepID=UPI00086F67D1|nr:bifunctional 2-C-methyl-D-erythritol 4-phosphate cytidylyltransferase/2-C-methyl-D-erythritol 2,4-cyclodiphosphate synthase [Devosia sp. 63-57]ODT49246.1 MAG: bifunctional 2-C-methyl-D-erythritol 4-phosphate cytidylyltransferase/2-C-methyl-D-erythritol 2,4-cyclodiphosphate synthase [Pelagibacterium sp. SCN 63-126]ODU85609.1 MAG: bifunctional 2-C-methyl-D-erythritol 4-phosphate cytidylyltransferase/2-C-methyl-D-erythritol 2,4-cyclodiphosphate synthase [Pelagibacterium sp. SCN 63-17]OJX43451.1 
MSERSKSIAVIIVAAGKGERVGVDGNEVPKQYRLVAGTPVLSRSIKAFLDHPQVTHVLPVINEQHRERFDNLGLGDPRLLPAIGGGANRQASVLAGLMALGPLRPDLVLIHDAARPMVSLEVIGDVIAVLQNFDGALPALPLTDTIKRSIDGRQVAATEDRRQLSAAQTPQGFRFGQILSAHMRAVNVRREFTDDAEIAEWAGLRVGMVMGDVENFKLTYPEDFVRAEHILTGAKQMETRIGTGYDVHSFEPGDAVWLCGVRIPYKAKLNGHSDADVALHALTDAILGAIGEGDIGVHFPPSDMQWKGAASTIFLRHASELVARLGGRIVNCDVTIVAEAPKIGPHASAMRAVIAETLGISASRVAVKATTNEKLGFIGREEGIVAMASASVEVPRID